MTFSRVWERVILRAGFVMRWVCLSRVAQVAAPRFMHLMISWPWAPRFFHALPRISAVTPVLWVLVPVSCKVSGPGSEQCLPLRAQRAIFCGWIQEMHP